jgi:hypothetical protein
LEEFFEVLIDLTKSKNENMRLRATAELLDRLIGKPQISADVSVTRVGVGAMYLAALQRARDNAHAVPGETVIDGGDSDGAALLAGEEVEVNVGHGMTLSDRRLQCPDLGAACHTGPGQRITSNPQSRSSPPPTPYF